MTRVTRPMPAPLVEAFIRLDRSAAVWLTEDATDRIVENRTVHAVAAE